MTATGKDVPSPAFTGTDSGMRVSASFRAWVHLLRPRQWVKNCFVMAPLLFSGKALEVTSQLRALLAFAAFCALASAVYAINDIVDRESDRAHPVKRLRPIAAGEIRSRAALLLAGVLVTAGLFLSFLVGRTVGLVALSYLALNVLYSFRLKHIVILDVFAVAAFFVLRLVAGAAAVTVQPSVWLILCGGLLALYLGFAKRRHEIILLGSSTAADHRTVLAQYSTAFLDQLSVVLLSVTIVSYIMYTLESETAREIGGEALSYSTVFVLYGVLRYLYLVHRHEDGNPAETLLTDKGLMLAVFLWVVYCGFVLYRPF